MSLENTDLNTARIYKPGLRFEIGTIVYLKSDLKRKTPLTITLLLYDSDQFDYRTSHFNSQKVEETGCFLDATLTL